MNDSLAIRALSSPSVWSQSAYQTTFSGHGTYLCSSCLTGIGQTATDRARSKSPQESNQWSEHSTFVRTKPDSNFPFGGDFTIGAYHPAKFLVSVVFFGHSRELFQQQQSTVRVIQVFKVD